MRTWHLLELLSVLSVASHAVGSAIEQERIAPLSLRYFNASTLASGSLLAPDRPPECPPCFDCTKPRFNCLQYGQCNEYDGQCRCPAGFGGEDCSKPLCGSLADGQERFARTGDDCDCKEGWTGLNCNVCQTGRACSALVTPPNSTRASSRSTMKALTALRDPDELPGDDDDLAHGAVCYKGGIAVKQVYYMCDVTNRKILDMLPDRAPQVTFGCDVPSKSCNFQFWIGKIESFYCSFDDCQTNVDPQANTTEYYCNKMQCSCIPGRMLCGEEGSINIDDFLAEEIKGPGKLICKNANDCIFDEPAMNSLINDVFGDKSITLDCDPGECLHYSEVPGYEAPAPPDNSRSVAISIALAGLVVVLASALFWYLGRTATHPDWKNGSIHLPDDDGQAKLLSGHTSASLRFSDVSYTINGRQVLSGVNGEVRPGQIMAIMGASGAGKSTLLDILARKTKRGSVSADVRVNGKKLSDSRYKRLVGFVDQEDTLMSTLTVYETVLYSALLRLPRDMSVEAKKMRTLETMNELGILGIKDSRIGDSGKRSISGGEKRRVSIACELVTSPSILFLDEPTSGLDSFNAYNVIEALVHLAKDYNRTVVFTIHQPRSNIVALFDHLLLLAGGRTVFSGPYSKCQSYFDSIGYPCPAGFNIADYLIDLTMQEEEAANATPQIAAVDDTEMQTPRTRKIGSWLTGKNGESASPKLSNQLKNLIDAYGKSDIAKELSEGSQAHENGVNGQAADPTELKSYRRASWWTQFTILSGRAFKNLYRNPMLMLAHYLVSVVVALICAGLFHGVTNDMAGFQNRMGLFFFVLSVFGFSCLTSLGVFANERILFMRERANGYYSPITYFTAKVLFDILPLRVVPPFILGAIIYGPVGLVPMVEQFWNLILVLILFNLTASSVVFLISIVISDGGVANLTGSLVMLFNLLFAGLLINRSKVSGGIVWLQDLSFFHAAFEALLVNEIRYLQLIDHRYGVDIEVPAATILSLFGFRAQAFGIDILTLVVMFAALLALAFAGLAFLVKERR